jgi:hypothetical protein
MEAKNKILKWKILKSFKNHNAKSLDIWHVANYRLNDDPRRSYFLICMQ